MNEAESSNTVVQEFSPQSVKATSPVKKQRGRPRMNIAWPKEEFTFNSLNEKNVLSSSSLRKKMKVELCKGGLVKTGTLKTAFGRPQNLYRKQI